MRPEQARVNTRIRQRATELKHNHCTMEFRQTGPHWGMYCAEHGTWIKWISQQDLAKLTAKIS